MGRGWLQTLRRVWIGAAPTANARGDPLQGGVNIHLESGAIAAGESPFRPRASSLAMTAVAFTLYLFTLAPTVLWGDDAELQRLAAAPPEPGAGRGHLLWLWLARLAQSLPWEEPAWRATLVSAVFGAATVGLVYATIARLTGPGGGAVLGAASLAVSHTFWLHSVRTEVYTLQLFIQAGAVLLAICWCQRRGRLLAVFLCGVVAGVGLLNHLLAVVMLPALAGAFWPLQDRRNQAGGLAFSAGLLLPVIPWLAFSWSWLLGESPARSLESLNPFAMDSGDLLLAAGLLLLQFPLGLPLAAGGWVRLRRRHPGAVRILIAGVAASLLFAAGFQVSDQYVFFLPAYPFIAVLIGAGAQSLLDEAREAAADSGRNRWRDVLAAPAALVAALVVVPVACYAAAPLLLEAAGGPRGAVREISGRDASFFLWPPKNGYQGARRFAEGAFVAMPERSVILADWTLAQPLLYLQGVEGRRRDVHVKQLGAGWGIQVPFLLSQAGERPVFLADLNRYYDLTAIRSRFIIEPAGPVYRLRLREGQMDPGLPGGPGGPGGDRSARGDDLPRK